MERKNRGLPSIRTSTEVLLSPARAGVGRFAQGGRRLSSGSRSWCSRSSPSGWPRRTTPGRLRHPRRMTTQRRRRQPAPTPSFAGTAPSNAEAIAAAHKPYPAEMPLQPGPVANIELGIVHRTVSIAPGIKYDAWAFDNGVLGPPMHVRESTRERHDDEQLTDSALDRLPRRADRAQRRLPRHRARQVLRSASSPTRASTCTTAERSPSSRTS